MSMRKPSKIEVTLEDKEEVEEARKRSASNTPASGAAFVLHHLDRHKDHSPPPVAQKQRPSQRISSSP